MVLVCLPLVHAAGQGRAGVYNPNPILVVAGLMLATAWHVW